MLRWFVLGVATVAMGCYRIPDHEACTIRCDLAVNPTCPGGLTCGADNLCNAGTPCDQLLDAPTTDGVDANEIDAPIAPDGSLCQTTALYSFCPTFVQPLYEVALSASVTLATDGATAQCTDVFEGVGGVEICVVAAETVSIAGRLRAVGRRPLMIYGRNGISISGRIDVTAGGAGTSATTCASEPGKNQGAAGGSAGGGAGGSFRGAGGFGGAYYPSTNGAASGPASAVLGQIRSGCAGGAGGANNMNQGAGKGGLPGGAVVLASTGSIDVTGSIEASGGGGLGTPSVINNSSGGGGGGSGGLIAFDANAIHIGPMGVLLAQGGGGGAGSTPNFVGAAGTTPSLAFPNIRAPGGLTDGASGDGGAGAGDIEIYGVIGGNATANSSSGGGGGGGSGLIFVLTGTRMIETGAAVYPNALP